MKKIYKNLIFFILFMLLFVINVKADVKDNSNIFTDEDKASLNQEISNFKDTTGYDIVIETIDNVPEGQTIESIASKKYPEIFPEEDGFYYLVSKDDGNLIIQFGAFNEIVTRELVNVMLLSMDTDFSQGNVLDGFKSSFSNGKVLIEENKREIQERESNHEVLEESPNKWLDVRVFVCIACVIIFIVNIIFLVRPSKSKKEEEDDFE